MSNFTRFFLRLGLFSLIVFLVFFLLEPVLPGEMQFLSFWVIQLIMISATLLFHAGLTKAARAGGQPFVRYYMGATSLKLLLFMVIMVLYGLVIKEKTFAFILHFFVLYLFYTTFEVVISYRSFGSLRGKT